MRHCQAVIGLSHLPVPMPPSGSMIGGCDRSSLHDASPAIIIANIYNSVFFIVVGF